MFCKEQIWFVHKDESDVYVYFLGDFTAKQGVRDITDIIMEKITEGSVRDPAKFGIDGLAA